jgi:hypothetical protein
MECPICFNDYDGEERLPLRTFCRCHQTLCKQCLQQLLSTSNFCPWDKTRWSGRNVMNKFVLSTPKDYLGVRKRVQEEEEAEKERAKTDSCCSGERPERFINDSVGGIGKSQNEELLALERSDYEFAKQLSLSLKNDFPDSSSSVKEGREGRKRTVIDLMCASNKENNLNCTVSTGENTFHQHPLSSSYSISRKKGRIDTYLSSSSFVSSSSSALLSSSSSSSSVSLSSASSWHSSFSSSSTSSTAQLSRSLPAKISSFVELLKDKDIMWICPHCTYENPSYLKTCEVCCH